MDNSKNTEQWPALSTLAGDDLWKDNYEQDFSYLLVHQSPPEGLDIQ
jgi:hypothetical protein